MLIVGSKRLNKGDRRQAFGLEIQEEVAFILQVCCGYWIADAILERSIVVIVGERLVVPLEQGVDGSVLRNGAVVGGGASHPGQGSVPAARVPLPTDVLGAEAVADCRDERAVWIGRVAVIQGWQQGCAADRGKRRNQVRGENRVHSVVLVERRSRNGERHAADGGDVAVLLDLARRRIHQQLPAGIQNRPPACRGVRIHRSTR